MWRSGQQADLTGLREGAKVVDQGPDEVVLLERRKAGAPVHRPLAALAAWLRGRRDAERAPHRSTSAEKLQIDFLPPSFGPAVACRTCKLCL
jgi:hypothetical protein